MRAWFMVAAMVLGLIGWWGEQGRSSRVAQPTDGVVNTMDDPGPVPSPKAP